MLFSVFLLTVASATTWAQNIGGKSRNNPPYFLNGADFGHFTISEDTAVGSVVYTIRAADPERSTLSFSISGDSFAVDKRTGDISLVKPLDRETEDTVEVIISVTDEPAFDHESNTVSIRREIPILDVNDNPPRFHDRPYSFSLSEAAKPGIQVFSNITVSDADFGLNSEINLNCQPKDVCSVFNVYSYKLSDGLYKGIITLSQALDYEKQSSYELILKASDSNPKNRLTSTAAIAIRVLDVQDQAPVFSNIPYSLSIRENTPPDFDVLTVSAKDGDATDKRPVIFSLVGDHLGYFHIVNHGNETATIRTTENNVDKENNQIVENGGIYTFYVKATELINNQVPGDETLELVTIIILDEDDQLPTFNVNVFRINVSEDISVGTPLPGLGMVVTDGDTGENAKFSLAIHSADFMAEEWFGVVPAQAMGKTPIVIRIINNEGFDFEAGVEEVQLLVVAFVVDADGNELEVSSAEVFINVLDANDNDPEFAKDNYVVNVAENIPIGSFILDVSATDRDSGSFAKLTYTLRGLGTDVFATNMEKGGIFAKNSLDFEKQSSYSLTLEAKDGGNRTSATTILINVLDVNDNAPIFEILEYRRNVREGASVFQPPFFIKATDADGVLYNKIKYEISSSNSEFLDVNEDTGELKLLAPSNLKHTPKGQYELKVAAYDSGTPPRSAEVDVTIKVGSSGNQRPVFEHSSYNASILETISPFMPVIRVRATDPDGIDDALEYRLLAGGDNFYIDPKSGLLSVSEDAILDLDKTRTAEYKLVVTVTDGGFPHKESAQAMVTVTIEDVNDKAPKFKDGHLAIRVAEDTPPGTVILTVKAEDPDRDANVRYRFVDPFRISGRGFNVKDTKLAENYRKNFELNSKTGEVKIAGYLDRRVVNIVIFTIEARDLNATENVEKQLDKAELTIYVETNDESLPVFKSDGWIISSNVLRGVVAEEQIPGSIVAKFEAFDPSTHSEIRHFRSRTIPTFFSLDPSGLLVIRERIDYEHLPEKVLKFSVEAVSENGKKKETNVSLEIFDINDHSPQFERETYDGSVMENAKRGTFVLTVGATDEDSKSASGYGNVTYSLGGEHGSYFSIDSANGTIKVADSSKIDREKHSFFNLLVIASDTPSGGKDQRKTAVHVKIETVDANDNAPVFGQKQYSGVILENSEIGTKILSVSASDADIGPAGTVTYEFINEFEAAGLFSVNPNTGEISTAVPLTGKGRSQAYTLGIRALDAGEPILFSDTTVKISIGDVVPNDGVPTFLHPSLNEIAYISEDAAFGSPVFKVVAVDPDDPFTPEGRIYYNFLEENPNFAIDSITGLITTKSLLDREKRNRYSVILVAKDSGTIPQQSTRVLEISVTDVDDNSPFFKRNSDEGPLVFSIPEESKIGTVIGALEATDKDVGDNAKIDYFIIDGNGEDLFEVSEANNSGIIQTKGRIDRESTSSFSFVVKCFKKNFKPPYLKKKYDKNDFTERQVVIKILDIDDNPPEFLETNSTIGIRLNTPADTLISVIRARDPDADSKPIRYSILTTSHSSYNGTAPFSLNATSGELRTNSSLTSFPDGYFNVVIEASNTNERNSTKNFIKIYVVRDRGLLKFVFDKHPSEVQNSMGNLKTEIEEIFPQQSAAHLETYDVQFHAAPDGSFDFTRTSSCFQIVGEENPKIMEDFLKDTGNEKLVRIYDKYHVRGIQKCGNERAVLRATWTQYSLLAIAFFIGVTSLISSCFLCCSYNRWQRLR